MEATIIDFGLYSIDTDYLAYLYSKDKEVFYNSYGYQRKPFLGIIVGLGPQKIFVPLTSAKAKHATWLYVSRDHMLIYEKKSKSSMKRGEIYKTIDGDNQNVNHIQSAIMFSKIIPVIDGVYKKVDVNKIRDTNYRNLIINEISFCLSNEEKILSRVESIYNYEKTKNKTRPHYTNVPLLEKECLKYKPKEH